MSARLAVAPGDEPLAEPRRQAPGQRDHAVAEALHLAEVDVRLAAVQALEEACRRKADEVPIAGVGRGEQREVVALDPAA